MNNYMKTVVAGIKHWVSTQFNKNKADWTVNDPSDPRYVENRTHWIGDPVETVLIPEQTVSFEVLGDNGQAVSPVTIELVEGQTYTVNFDGVTYECIPNLLEGVVPYIGSATFWGVEDTGEPFICLYANGQSMWLAYNTETEHVLSMTTIAPEIVKIPDKFLPYYDFAGKNVSGKTIMGFDGNAYDGGMCAEIFNDFSNKAASAYSHAEGSKTTAISYCSHAEGCSTKASGQSSHAEGTSTTASNHNSHAEGAGTKASGFAAHAEGISTTSSGYGSHAEGEHASASGEVSHAEGLSTTAYGQYSHAEGYVTKASSKAQHVQGKYNIEDTEEKYAHIVGNGESDDARSNAHTVDWNGLGWFAGGLKVGGTGQDDGAATEVALKTDLAKSYLATIGIAWEEDSETGVKYQVVSVPELTGADDEKPFVDHTDSSIDGTSEGYALFVEEENQYLEFITNGRAETVAGGIRFEIFGDANTIEIPIEVRVG